MVVFIGQAAPEASAISSIWEGAAVVVSFLALILSIVALRLSDKRQVDANSIAGDARNEARKANAIAVEAKDIALQESERSYRVKMYELLTPAASAMQALADALQGPPRKGRAGEEFGELVGEAVGSLSAARSLAGAGTAGSRAVSHSIKIVMTVLEVVLTYRSISPEELSKMNPETKRGIKRLAETSISSLKVAALYVNRIPSAGTEGPSLESLESDLGGLLEVCRGRLERLEQLGFKGVLFQNEELLLSRLEE